MRNHWIVRCLFGILLFGTSMFIGVGPADAAPRDSFILSGEDSLEDWKARCWSSGWKVQTIHVDGRDRTSCWSPGKTVTCSSRDDGTFLCLVTARRQTGEVLEATSPRDVRVCGISEKDIIVDVEPGRVYRYLCTNFRDIVVQCVSNAKAWICTEYVPLGSDTDANFGEGHGGEPQKADLDDLPKTAPKPIPLPGIMGW